MRILTRRSGESLYIDISESVDPSTPIGELFADGPIEIEVVQAGRQVKLGIDAAPTLAWALDVGNQVDVEPSSLLERLIRFPPINRVTISVLGGIVAVSIAALGWLGVTGEPPGGYPRPAPREEVQQAPPVAGSQVSAPWADITVADDRDTTEPTRDISDPEPLPVAQHAVIESPPEQAVPIAPGEPVMPEQPVAQERALLNDESVSNPAALPTDADSSDTTTQTRDVSVPEPLPMAQYAVTESPSDPAGSIAPVESVTSEPVAQEPTLPSDESVIRAAAVPMPEPAAQQVVEDEHVSDAGPVDGAGEVRSKSGRMAFSTPAALAKQESTPTQQVGTTVSETASGLSRALRSQAGTGVLREAWLLEQARDRYTLQLFGVSREFSVRAFLRTQQLDGPVAYYRTTYRGKDWFVVLYGNYPDVSSAREGFANLPLDARKAGFYARTMASVQASIAATAAGR